MFGWKAYVKDTRATVTIFAIVTFAFLIGFTGLIFDVGRIFNLHSQAQAYADETALAAAAELDGETGAIDRAIRAVNTDDGASFIDPGFRLTLSQDSAVNIQSLTFMASIADDPAPGTRQPVAGDDVLCTWSGGTDDCVAAHDAIANFVLVTTTVETENYIMFPIARFLVPAMQDEASVQPQAVAGFTREICNYPPMVICNPFENASGGGGVNVGTGQQILLQTKGSGGGTWAPGDFGFLDLGLLGANGCTGGGANYLRCILATLNPNTACTRATVDFEPGNKESVDVGFNTRFDIFDAPFQNDTDNANFPPDINVTKGIIPNGCKLSGDNDNNEVPLEPLPIDPTLSPTNRVSPAITRDDLRDLYWTPNHGNNPTLPATVNTRYQAYLHEIANNMIPDNTEGGTGVSPPLASLPDIGEDGNPSCSSITPAANRRKMVVAVVNCKQHGVTGAESNVPVVEFIEMFLTNHVEDGNIYAEVISVVEPGGLDGVLHEFPVLNR